jgi:hypothetical protein
MSRGDLQEMEVGTKQSKSAVNANAKPADPMQRLTTGIPDGQSGSWEDLGGPDPENYRPDDDSAKLKTPGETLKQVKDVVNKGAKPADSMKGLHKEEEEVETDNFIEEENLEVNESEMELEEVQESSEEETVAELSEEDNEEDNEEGDEEVVEEQYDIEEDVNALLEGEELSEEFQEKARIIFESALNSKVSQIKEDLEEKYSQALIEEVQEIKIHLSERVDAYLEYVSSEWFTENKLVLENGLKTEMTESFLTGMRSLFEEHYVSIPEDKYDVLESMVEKLDEMETKLNEQIEKNVSLNKRLAESVAEGIFEQISSGLADTQKDKLASLAESVEFESEEEYREKLETLKESYFPSRVVSPSAKTETLSEGVDISSENISDSMSAYLRTLSTFSK